MKLSTFSWFLKNPQFLPQAFRIVQRRLFDKPERYCEEQAINWCKENTMSLANVFEALNILDFKENLNLIYKSYFDYADEKVKEIPVRMGGRGGLEVLYNLVVHFKPERILETGVAYGWSSLVMLIGIKKNNKGRLTSVDMPYVNMNNEPYVGAAIHPDLKDKWVLIRKADRQGIPDAINSFNNHLDFVHYDSDKSYSGRRWAYPILWKALNSGGILISDDIQDNIGFQEFCETLDVRPLIYESDNKYVGIIQKPI